MKKTKNKMLALMIAIIMLVSMVLPVVPLGAGAVPPPPHIGINMEASVAEVQPGQEITVDLDMTLLTDLGFRIVIFWLHYDYTRLELIPYSQGAFTSWVGIDFNDWWVMMGGRASISRDNPHIGDPRDVLVSISSGQVNPFPAALTLRFRVLDNAPAGEAVISWTPHDAATMVYLPDNIFATGMVFADPTPESYARVTVRHYPAPPHIAINMEASVAEAQPGQEITVELDMTMLTDLGFRTVLFWLHYDYTRLELIPYSQGAFTNWVGIDFNAWWVMMGGRASVFRGNPLTGNPRDIHVSVTSGQVNPFPATITLRFRVLDNAPAGEAVIRWTPRDAATMIYLPNNIFATGMVFADPTPESYARVMIDNPVIGEWYNAPGEGWVFHNAGIRHMGWLQWEGDLFFMNPANNGVMVTSITMSINGVYHIFDATGRWQGTLEGWQQRSAGWVFYIEGIRHMGWLDWNGDRYFLNPANHGAMVTNAIINIDGVYHSFNAQGVWQGAV